MSRACAPSSTGASKSRSSRTSTQGQGRGRPDGDRVRRAHRLSARVGRPRQPHRPGDLTDAVTPRSERDVLGVAFREMRTTALSSSVRSLGTRRPSRRAGLRPPARPRRGDQPQQRRLRSWCARTAPSGHPLRHNPSASDAREVAPSDASSVAPRAPTWQTVGRQDREIRMAREETGGPRCLGVFLRTGRAVPLDDVQTGPHPHAR